MKLTVLGGSSIASPELFAALGAHPVHPALRVVLQGRDELKLERVGRICAQVAAHNDNVHVEWTTDLARALDGADFILNQVRVGGLSARAFDESFPHQFDIPGEETIGPGGFANALRTVPVCLAYVREIEQRAPSAWLLNLTNPAGIVSNALSRASRVCVVSVCDSPVTLIENVAKLLDLHPHSLRADYIGMLHFGFVVGLPHEGKDLMPAALAKISQLPGLVADPRFIQALGVIPNPYLNYFFAPDLMLSRQRARGATRASELQDLETQILSDYDGGSITRLGKRAAVWYEKIIVPVLLALMGQPSEHIVNVPNGETVPFLPPDTIIETRARVSPQGIEARPCPPVPRDVQAMLQLNSAYEALVVEAIMEDSYVKAWRALELNPLIHGADQARAILDMLWSEKKGA